MMITYKILTLLIVLIILNYCSASKDLTENEKLSIKKFHHCVASLTEVGFKYYSGFLNYNVAMQFSCTEFNKKKTHGKGFEKYVNDMFITRKSEDEKLNQITEEERKDAVKAVIKFYNQVRNIQIGKSLEIKNPKDFCNEVCKDIVSNDILIEKCTDEILRDYDEENKYGNVLITYNEVSKWDESTVTREGIDTIIETWPEYIVMYLKYHLNMMVKHNLEMSNFIVEKWCNNYLETKYNTSNMIKIKNSITSKIQSLKTLLKK